MRTNYNPSRTVYHDIRGRGARFHGFATTIGGKKKGSPSRVLLRDANRKPISATCATMMALDTGTPLNTANNTINGRTAWILSKPAAKANVVTIVTCRRNNKNAAQVMKLLIVRAMQKNAPVTFYGDDGYVTPLYCNCNKVECEFVPYCPCGDAATCGFTFAGSMVKH